MTCHKCPAFPGYLEPVPGASKDTYRPVCADHKGPDAIAVDPGDMVALHLFGYEPASTGEQS